jgi:hypothetical protein
MDDQTDFLNDLEYQILCETGQVEAEENDQDDDDELLPMVDVDNFDFDDMYGIDPYED